MHFLGLDLEIGCEQDNEKRNILAVQTLRNSIMGSTLLATTAILLSSAVAAFLASSYDVKQRISSSVLGSQSAVSLGGKYMVLLSGFLSAFLCYVQSVRYTNHVNFNINLPDKSVTPDYVADVLERAANFHTIGTRAFYMTIPLLLWLFGPIPFFASTIVLVPTWYHLDSAIEPESRTAGSVEQGRGESLKKANDLVSAVVSSDKDRRPVSRPAPFTPHIHDEDVCPVCHACRKQ
ncbi:hypothetical protein Mapa_003673 [Marchantia paleacea]|nr:hypothetical protein Mapa_003673 [Marchantia paleacea]